MFSLQQLDILRTAEIDKIASFFTPGARVLEIGAGTGKQALEMQRRGFDVVAIEIPSSNYASDRIFPILDYDGRTIPLPDASVDIVFSSNVLEHVPDLTRMNSEVRRVLKPGGYAVHVIPTHAWRFWTIATAFPDAVVFFVTSLPRLAPRFEGGELRRLGHAWYKTIRGVVGRIYERRHGERGSTISELWLFHPDWWRRNFQMNGFDVVHDESMGLFYTGKMLFGTHLGLDKRECLAKALGSACHLFKVRPS